MRIAVAGGTGAVGRHVVEVARQRGHEAIVLARAQGVDLVSGAGLAGRLAEVDAVIDVTSVGTQSAAASRAFFGGVTSRLLEAEESAGVGHHVALSIVGATSAPYGYYAGKALQEELVAAGRVPWTILRATQFHEFAGQMYERFHVGPFALVPTMVSQPVAAREVAERLVGLVEAGPVGRAADLAGPEELRMADMVRAWLDATGTRARVVRFPLPGGFGKAMRDGTILAGAEADRGTQTFADWLRLAATA